jgi:hypothetical protein
VRQIPLIFDAFVARHHNVESRGFGCLQYSPFFSRCQLRARVSTTV